MGTTGVRQAKRRRQTGAVMCVSALAIKKEKKKKFLIPVHEVLIIY